MFDILANGGRVLFRGRMLTMTGRPVRIGPDAPRRSAALGKINWSGKSESATISIGRTKGVAPRNRRGHCASAPDVVPAEAIDKWFGRLRASQVGREKLGATRLTTSGWYKGVPERSLVYQVFYNSETRETPAEFRRNMRRLAEDLSEHFCQDEVIVSVRRGDSAKGVTWDPPKRKKR